MTQDPRHPAGFGTPSAGQPEFTPPTGASPSPSPWPGAWAAPDAAARVPTPPTGREHSEPRRRRRAAVAIVLAGGMLLIGILSALPLVPVTLPAPAPVVTPSPAVTTVSPASRPAAVSTLTSGGGLGRPVEFQGTAGAGSLTVTRATWTDAGDASPPAGRRYLILDVTVDCTTGEVPVGPVLLLASSGDAAEFPGFGPSVERPLTGRVLSAGEQVSGQVGYVLPAGAAQLHLLDEELHRLAGVEVPAP